MKAIFERAWANPYIMALAEGAIFAPVVSFAAFQMGQLYPDHYWLWLSIGSLCNGIITWFRVNFWKERIASRADAHAMLKIDKWRVIEDGLRQKGYVHWLEQSPQFTRHRDEIIDCAATFPEYQEFTMIPSRSSPYMNVANLYWRPRAKPSDGYIDAEFEELPPVRQIARTVH